MQGIPAVSLKVTFSEGEWFYMRSELWRRVDVQVSLFTAVIVAILSYSIFMVQYRIDVYKRQDIYRPQDGEGVLRGAGYHAGY